MALQTTYSDRIGLGYAGQVIDMTLTDIVSREVESAAIGFGKAVIRGTGDRGCKVGGAGEFIGLTVRDITLPPDRADAYAVGDTAAVMTKGTMLVTAASAVDAGDAVYRTPTGTLTAAKGVRTAEFGTPVGDGNGALGAITVDANNPPSAGTYTVRIVKAATDAGDFEVIRDADGALVGVGSVAVAFNNGGMSFTIADGDTNWALGTTIPITVSGGNTLIENAVWDTTAAQNNLARIRLR